MSSDVNDIYQALLDSGLNEGELKQRIKAKADEFKGFISKEGILHLIAGEVGLKFNSDDYEVLKSEIDYNDFAIDISELKENMSNIVLQGRVERIYKIKEFARKDNTTGIVGSFVLSDGADSVKIVLWDGQVNIMRSEYFRRNELIRIVGGYSKVGNNGSIEVHIGRKGEITLAPEDIKSEKYPLLEDFKELTTKNHSACNISELSDFTGFIEKIEGKIKKIELFKEIDKKNGEKTFLLKFILSDDTADIMVNVWGMNAVNCLKVINEGDSIVLSSVFVKTNSYSAQNEIVFTQQSLLKDAEK